LLLEAAVAGAEHDDGRRPGAHLRSNGGEDLEAFGNPAADDDQVRSLEANPFAGLIAAVKIVHVIATGRDERHERLARSPVVGHHPDHDVRGFAPGSQLPLIAA